MHSILQPDGWAAPRGYSNGIAAEGRFVFVAGQVGWNAQGMFESDDLVAQVRQTLENVVAVLATGGAAPEHLVQLTWYVVDKREYLTRAKEIGEVYREVIGRVWPAMAMVEVSGLLEDRARVEIQAVAVLPAR